MRLWELRKFYRSQRHSVGPAATVGNFFFFIDFPRKQTPKKESDKSNSNLTEGDDYVWL